MENASKSPVNGDVTSDGLLLFNLGTPDAPDRKSVARYLREFLSDPRIVDLPRWLWLPLLNCVIIPLRAGRSAQAYAKIWTDAGSPLLDYSRRLAEKLEAALQPEGSHVRRAALGMRYGKPSIHDALAELKNAGAESVTVLPLYPQFSDTTVTSGYDAVDAALEVMDWNPPMRRIYDFHVHPAWVKAIAESIRAFQAEHGGPDRLLLSMHGIPQRYADAGDPYEQQCKASAAAIAAELGLDNDDWLLTFQSRFGREPWLQPYTDKTLEALAADGVRHVQVICPGFSVDCLETLEEIAMENREIFEEAGGEKLEYIPALNDSDAHVRALLEIVRSA